MIIAARILYVLCICGTIEEFIIQLGLKKIYEIKPSKLEFISNIFFFLLFLFSLIFTIHSDLYFSVFFLVFEINMVITDGLSAYDQIKVKENEDKLKELEK